MSIKKIITSGCSFTEIRFEDTWPWVLKEKFPNLDYDFLGLESSGNEIIQKRATFALMEALKKYKPEEILVMVMWSTHDRKTFFVDHHQASMFIDDWRNERDSFNVCAQFTDIRGEFKSPIIIKHPEGHNTKIMRASHTPGWLNLHNSHTNSFEKLYYHRIHNLDYGINLSLESILLLTMLCEKHNVKFVYSFIISDIIHTMVNNVNEINMHLVDEFLKYPFIKESPYSYLLKFNDKSLFRNDGLHPNIDGHKKFLENIMLPWIEKTYPNLLPAGVSSWHAPDSIS